MGVLEPTMNKSSAVVLSASIALGVGFYAGTRAPKLPAVPASGGQAAMQPAGAATSYLQVDLFEAGTNSIVARPVFPLHSGVVIPIKNMATTPLTFGRFDLVGAMPAISRV